MLYSTLKQIDDFFREHGYWDDPRDRRYFRSYLTNTWRSAHENEKFGIEVVGFQAYRDKTREIFEDLLKRNAERLISETSKRKMITDALDRIEIIVPLTEYG
ncbi:MAG: hypothetical protein QXQ40_00645 [Candidatus Aenigmatarchaeota archaeon]